MRYVESVPDAGQVANTGGPLAGLAALAVFLLCFLGTNAWLGSALPPPASSLVAQKLAAFEAHKDEYDTVFLGASTVYRHVDPGTFDATLAAAGEPSHSFNLGAAAMGGLEIRYALSRVLEMRPARLRRVFVELQVMDLNVPEVNLLTGRVTGWHDGPTTGWALQLVLAKAAGWKGVLARLPSLRDHLHAWFFHVANVGRARVLMEDPLLGTREERGARAQETQAAHELELGAAQDGWCSLDHALAGAWGERAEQLRARRAALKRRRTEFQTKARNKRAWKSSKRVPNAAESAFVSGMVQAAEAAGVELVFFISPYVNRTDSLGEAAARAGLLPLFLDLSRPSKHPGLFDLRQRFDWNHLNERGAQLFTRTLAEVWLAQRAQERDG